MPHPVLTPCRSTFAIRQAENEAAFPEILIATQVDKQDLGEQHVTCESAPVRLCYLINSSICNLKQHSPRVLVTGEIKKSLENIAKATDCSELWSVN